MDRLNESNEAPRDVEDGPDVITSTWPAEIRVPENWDAVDVFHDEIRACLVLDKCDRLRNIDRVTEASEQVKLVLYPLNGVSTEVV